MTSTVEYNLPYHYMQTIVDCPYEPKVHTLHIAMTIHAEFGFISLESFEKTFVNFAYSDMVNYILRWKSS
jgi:hypothetical protein